LTVSELIKQGLEKIKTEIDDFVKPFIKHNAHTPFDKTPPNLNPSPKPMPQIRNTSPRNPKNPKNPEPYPSRHYPKNPQYPPRSGGFVLYKGILPIPQGGYTLS
jgi:hypothetical protein